MMHATASPPGPTEQDNWYVQGSCRHSGLGPEAWFDGDTTSATSRRARIVCNGCPVIAPCLRDALRMPETVGIWGGLDEHERHALIAAQRREQRRIGATP